MPTAKDRKAILEKAIACVCKDREKQYGDPHNNFAVIARLWREYLNTDQNITPHDVAVMMALLKIARIMSGEANEDNYIDACGYMSIAGELKGED